MRLTKLTNEKNVIKLFHTINLTIKAKLIVNIGKEYNGESIDFYTTTCTLNDHEADTYN